MQSPLLSTTTYAYDSQQVIYILLLQCNILIKVIRHFYLKERNNICLKIYSLVAI